MSKKLYVICNSHLDPVWIWQRRSGRTAWTNTVHSVLRMMERHPEMKFTCSSSAMYRWIEQTEPQLFKSIREMVACGRWEIVGGWEVQSDAIIASTESLIRQGQMGKAYFQDKFGVDVKIGYTPDSFGHTAGLPKILNATGFSRYTFMRPHPYTAPLPLLFNWDGDDGSRVTALRIFFSYALSAKYTREEFFAYIKQHLDEGLEKQTLFFGVGDHGGGIYERHLQWLREAADYFGVEVVFSTLSDYFDEVEPLAKPTVQGELGPVFRGCYAACHEVKRLCALGTGKLLTAERLGVPAQTLETPWRELLFNHFHDVLPGTSIMKAYKDDIFPGLGSAIHAADLAIDQSLCRHSAALDTSFMDQGGLLVRNTMPMAVTAPVAVTGFADPNANQELFNCLVDRDGNRIPVQLLPPPTMFGPDAAPWGDLTAMISLPPGGETVLGFAHCGNLPELPSVGFARQEELLSKLSFQLFYDDCGTWGFTLKNYLHTEDTARLVSTEKLSDGPACSLLRAKYILRSSEIQLDMFCYAGLKDVRLKMLINFQEKRSCLKLSFNHGLSDFVFSTGSGAGAVERLKGDRACQQLFFDKGQLRPAFYPSSDEVSMQEWCGAFSANGSAAFFSSDLHACDHADGLMRLTLLRTTPYADHHPFPRNEQTGYQDIGMTSLELWLSLDDSLTVQNTPQRASLRLNGLEALEITGHQADTDAIPACPPCPLTIDNPDVVLEAMRLIDDGHWEIHLMNHGETYDQPIPGGSVTIGAHSLKIFTL